MNTFPLLKTRHCQITAMVLLFLVLFSSRLEAGDGPFFQLKIYTIESNEQEVRLDSYLEQAFLPAMHRAGIDHVGVFKPVAGNALEHPRIVVLIPFESLTQFSSIDDVLWADRAYLDAGADYLNAAHDNPPYVRIESILLNAFSAMPEYRVPSHATPPGERIYELRSYQGATEKLYRKKVEMFNEGGEAKIFMDLGFQPVFFGEVISGAEMPNLMYLTTFENQEAQKTHWDAFRNAPAWNALKSDPQYNNTVSHIDRLLLYPTVYSDM